MANQPKKYKKFVATAATATLVASAIVPVASAKSFNDVADSNDHKANIDKISDLGYMGTGDNFNPAGNLTRGQVAIILANWAKDAAGKEVPADYKTAQRFEDVELTADDKLLQSAALVFDNEIFSGSNGNLLPANEITRLQMALVLNKAYKAIYGVTLEELAGDTSDVEIGDLDLIPAEHQGVVKALKKLKITAPANFNPNGKVTRGQFATFFIKTIEAEGAELQVNSVTAVGAKKLEVKFNKAVDTSKAAITVKKGTISTNVAKVTFADDKKSAVIELSTKLSAGEYTVSVAGLTTDAITKSVKAEDEKISKIELQGDIAVIDATDSDEATIGYKVTNQYGENVTAASNALVLTTTAADTTNTDYNPTTGVITLDNGGTAYKSGDKVTVSLLDAASGTFVSKVVTVSDKAQTSEIAITGLYHADDKVLTADTATADVPSFKLLIDAKDQYGNNVVPTASDVVVTTSDASVIDIDVNDITTETINGETKTVLALTAPTTMKAGTATITIISKTTGKLAKFDVVVGNGVKADTINLTAPELVVADETVKVPYSVLDLSGKEITSESVLETAGKGVTFTTPAGITLDFAQNYLTGKAELNLAVADTVAPGKYTIIAQAASGKTSTLVVDVKAKAVPTIIVGLNSSVATNIVKGEQLTISEDNVLVQDQYGRTIGLDSLLSTTSDYNLVLTEPTASGKVTIDTATVNADNGSLVVTGDVKGSTSLQLKLQKHNGTAFVDVANSAYTFNTSVVEKADIVSYEIGETGPIYDDANTAYKKDLTVYGVLSNGTKVVVPESWYTVTTNNAALTYATGELDANGVVGADNKDVTVTVDVVVDAAKTPVFLSKDVTVTVSAPVVAKTVVSTSVENGAVTFAAADVNATTFAGALQDLFTFTDQYGEEVDNDDATITFTNLVNADGDTPGITVSGANGTTTADIDYAEAGDSLNATIRLKGYTTTIKVIVTP